MRSQLTLDRPRLEALLLRNLDVRANSLDVNNLSHLESLAREFQDIKEFRYIKSLRVSLHDEKEIQQSAVRVIESYEHRLREGIDVLCSQLKFSSRPNTAQIKRIYDLLKSDFPSRSIDSYFVSENKPIAAPLDSLHSEVIDIFAEKNPIASDRAYIRLLRVEQILGTLRNQRDRVSATHAHSISTFIYDQATHLKGLLLDHVAYVRRHYATQLGHRGKPTLHSAELAQMHTLDCARLESELNVIIELARSVPFPQTRFESSLIIGTRCDKSCDSLARTLSAYGEVERFKFIPYITLRTDEFQAAELLSRPSALFGNKQVSIFEPQRYSVSPIRSTVYDKAAWNLELVGAPAAWKRTRGEGATVAVIDTGVDYRHSDLKDRFSSVTGKNFIDGGDDPYDDNGHGTHVAGSVAGAKTGVAPGASLYAVKVLDMEGSGSEVDVLRGIEWAIEQKVDVMNMSLGSSHPSEPQAELIRVAAQRGIAVCCAAGNDGSSGYGYPASFPGAISVAAVNSSKKRASFSNYNDAVDLAAPGVSIYSTVPGGYDTLSGTSMATPHVAGGCALLASIGVRDIESRLKQTAQKIGERKYVGAGLINLAEALR